MGQILSLLVQNKAGVLLRVVELVSQDGYNIESLNVAPTYDPGKSRITLSAEGDERTLGRLVEQLDALADVTAVSPYTPSTHVARELALVRVRITEENRTEVLALSEVFRARVVDAGPQSYILEITGDSEKIDAFLQNLRAFGIEETHRTGKLAVPRGSAVDKEITAPA
jgi:acetolactate synthase-1/3 small subunit